MPVISLRSIQDMALETARKSEENLAVSSVNRSIGNVACVACSSCVGCVACVGCYGCVGCVGLVGCAFCVGCVGCLGISFSAFTLLGFLNVAVSFSCVALFSQACGFCVNIFNCSTSHALVNCQRCYKSSGLVSVKKVKGCKYGKGGSPEMQSGEAPPGPNDPAPQI